MVLSGARRGGVAAASQFWRLNLFKFHVQGKRRGKENCRKGTKGILFREFWAPKPTHMGGTQIHIPSKCNVPPSPGEDVENTGVHLYEVAHEGAETDIPFPGYK